MVVVVAGGEQDHVEAGGAGVGGHAEAERVAVEGDRAVEVGDAQVHVADPHGGVDGFAGHAAQSPGPGARCHRSIHLSTPRDVRDNRDVSATSPGPLVGRAAERAAIAASVRAGLRRARDRG